MELVTGGGNGAEVLAHEAFLRSKAVAPFSKNCYCQVENSVGDN